MDTDSFQQIVRNFYGEYKRDLPWRNTKDPYAIFVSEIMLQQTQASRVIPKYSTWLETWPSFESLAQADKSDVLTQWQGLGYNRRGKFLHQSAQRVIDKHSGKLPESEAKLKELSGVGPYTAGALQAFCFEKPVVFVETNIRTVFIHHFFTEQDDIPDKQIKQKVKDTLPSEDIREWYWGLMDYGKHLKDTVGNLNSRSKTYQTQTTFEGSNRQLRSQLLRFVLENQPTDLDTIQAEIQPETDRQNSIKENLDDLAKEDMITQTDNNTYQIAK